MALDSRFTGREEKRLPVVMEAKLAPAERASERQERAQVENISALGARLCASSPWQPGEQVEIAPVLGKQLVIGDQPLRGEVVYCQKQAEGRFVVGLKFRRSPGMSSMLEKLKGLIR